MSPAQTVKEYLHSLRIDFKIVDHPAVFTTADADLMIEDHIGVRTKTLFLTNKKKNAYYLVIMDGQSLFDFSKFAQLVNQKKIKFANDTLLKNKLGLKAGMVSPFGLLNNSDHDVQVFMDQQIIDQEVMTFHPNINTETLFIKTADLLKFFQSLDYKLEVINLT